MDEQFYTLVGHTIADRWGNLLAVDPRFCEIMHRDERQLIGVGFQTLTHPDDCQRNVAEVSGLKVGAGPYNIRKRYIRPDGTVIWADIQVSRLREGTAERLVSTVQLMDVGFKGVGPESLFLASKREFEAVQRRRQAMGNELFLDYGWLVLLQCYLAEAEGRVATVEVISAAADMRPILVTRWLEVIAQQGFIEKTSFLNLPAQLTTHGFQQIEYLLKRIHNR